MLSSRMIQLVHLHLAKLFRCFDLVPLVVVTLARVVAMVVEPMTHLVLGAVATVVGLLLEALILLMLIVAELHSIDVMMQDARWLLLSELGIFRVSRLQLVACSFEVGCIVDRCANPLDAILLGKVDKRGDLGGLELPLAGV